MYTCTWVGTAGKERLLEEQSAGTDTVVFRRLWVSLPLHLPELPVTSQMGQICRKMSNMKYALYANTDLLCQKILFTWKGETH